MFHELFIATATAGRRRAITGMLASAAVTLLNGEAAIEARKKKTKKKNRSPTCPTCPDPIECPPPDTCPQRICCDCLNGTQQLGCTYVDANADPNDACRDACRAIFPAPDNGYNPRLPVAGAKTFFCTDGFSNGVAEPGRCVRVNCPI